MGKAFLLILLLGACCCFDEFTITVKSPTACNATVGFYFELIPTDFKNDGTTESIKFIDYPVQFDLKVNDESNDIVSNCVSAKGDEYIRCTLTTKLNEEAAAKIKKPSESTYITVTGKVNGTDTNLKINVGENDITIRVGGVAIPECPAVTCSVGMVSGKCLYCNTATCGACAVSEDFLNTTGFCVPKCTTGEGDKCKTCGTADDQGNCATCNDGYELKDKACVAKNDDDEEESSSMLKLSILALFALI